MKRKQKNKSTQCLWPIFTKEQYVSVITKRETGPEQKEIDIVIFEEDKQVIRMILGCYKQEIGHELG